MKSAIAHFVLLAIAATGAFAQTEKQLTDRPVAMDWRGGNLFVLSEPGTVSIYDAAHRRLLRTFPLTSKIRPAGIVTARISKAETIFVSGFYGRQSVVLQYALDGKLLTRFNTPDLAAGMAIDPSARLVYVASPVSRTVFAIPLDGTNHTPRRLAYVGPSRTLGPVIFDEPRRRLLVADTQSGTLYAIDCRSGAYTTVTSGLGGPVALAFDISYAQLYVADYTAGKITILSVSSDRRPKTVQTALRGLSSLAAAPGAENLFIGDEDRGVFLFSTKTGQKSSTW